MRKMSETKRIEVNPDIHHDGLGVKLRIVAEITSVVGINDLGLDEVPRPTLRFGVEFIDSCSTELISPRD